LISSSVPDLSAKSITVVDETGNLLLAANGHQLDVSQPHSQIEQAFNRAH
jgi:flagellar M-ring protein FliF